MIQGLILKIAGYVTKKIVPFVTTLVIKHILSKKFK